MAGEKNVVVLNGIMGSPLFYEDGPSAGRQYWVDPELIKSVGPGVLQLAADGDSPGPIAKGISLTVSQALQPWQNLNALVLRLVAEAWHVFIWNYDWRMDIIQTAARLADHLLGQFTNEDFYVLGYSMGGLLARLAYPTWRAALSPATWKRTLFVGVPQYGSFSAAQSLSNPFGGLPPSLPSLSTLANPFAFSSWIARMSNGGFQLPQVVASWPALFQLLPSISPPFVPTGNANARLWNAGTYLSTNPAVVQQSFNLAIQARTALDVDDTAPEPPMRTVAGSGVPTAGDYNGVFSPGVSKGYASVDGDGVVPLSRCTAGRFVASLTLSPALHRDLLLDPRFLSVVSDLLSDDTVAPTNPLLPTSLPAKLPSPPTFTTTDLPIIPGKGTQQRGDPPA